LSQNRAVQACLKFEISSSGLSQNRAVQACLKFEISSSGLSQNIAVDAHAQSTIGFCAHGSYVGLAKTINI